MTTLCNSGASLQTLHLGTCSGTISQGALLEFLPQLPLLQDLQISLMFMATTTIEALGQGCPNLRSFDISIQMLSIDEGFNEHAISIANTMTGLIKLKISANKLSCKGVEQILNRCTQLKTLDLQGCQQLPFTEHIKDRCRNQVHNLSSI